VQASVNERSQLEIDAFWRPQPVKVLQHRCDVLIPRRSMYKSGGGVEHRLKALDHNHRMNTLAESCLFERASPGQEVGWTTDGQEWPRARCGVGGVYLPSKSCICEKAVPPPRS